MSLSPAQYREITLPGLTGDLAALQCGDPDGPGVMALHGWLDNAAGFLPLAAAMPDCNLVALDFPGHGNSQHRPPGSRYHLTDYVMDVAIAAGHLGWRDFTMLGHSLGAGVAMLCVAAGAVNAGRLVLLDGIAPLTEAAADAPARLQRSVAAVVAAKERNIRVYDDREQLLQARLRASAMTRESAELLLRRSTREEAGKIRLLSDPRLRDPSATYLHERQVLALVAAINTPALLILARSGEVIRRPQTTARIRAFTDLQVVEMEGHHHLHMDNAEAVARTVRPFLAA